MDYISTKEAAEKWGITTSRITFLANEGRIPGAYRLGKSWLIPANAAKPKSRRTNRSDSEQKGTAEFFFPLYHLRPDWNYASKIKLSPQQQSLLKAETAVLRCRFKDAYPMLKEILRAPDDTIIEIGCLWNMGICCIVLNKSEEFSRYFLKLQLLLSQDFPYRDELTIILDSLKTYVATMDSIANSQSYSAHVHKQALPLFCVQIGYVQLSKETLHPGEADTTMLEIILALLESTSSTVALEWMHCYLLGIHYLRGNVAEAKKHAEAIVKLAYKSKLCYPLVMYYNYFANIFSLILPQYPENFQKQIRKLVTQYDKNVSAFLTAQNEHAITSNITEKDYPFIYGALANLSNTKIAKKYGISASTVKRRLIAICEKLGVKTKKELIEYLHNNM